MNAYKFLSPGAVGLFSDFTWPPPGEWVETRGPLVDCVSGVHAVRFEHLLDWIDDELWEVELGGEVVERDDMLVAERGRLLRRVERWDADAARAFAEACAARVGAIAADAPVEEVVAFAADLGSLVAGGRPESHGRPPGTTVVQTPGAVAANAAFVAAHAAGRAAVASASDEAAYEAGFDAERDWQLARFRELCADGV